MKVLEEEGKKSKFMHVCVVCCGVESHSDVLLMSGLFSERRRASKCEFKD